MKIQRKYAGMSMMETTIVVAVIAIMAAVSSPVAKMITNAMDKNKDAQAMVSAALSTARNMAMEKQKHVGIRFQTAYIGNAANPYDIRPLEKGQYMVFVEKLKAGDSSVTMADGYRAVGGLRPIKMPTFAVAVDMNVRIKYGDTNDLSGSRDANDVNVNSDNLINDDFELNDILAFSIIFSPNGKLVTRKVQVRNKNGKCRAINEQLSGYDDIFNSTQNIVTNKLGIFAQDDYAPAGLGKEYSKKKFVICDKAELIKYYKKGEAYSKYLEELSENPCRVNPFSGAIIKKRQ